MASYYGKYNIRVNAVCPTVIDTPMGRSYMDQDDHIVNVIKASIPMKRFGEAFEVAKLETQMKVTRRRPSTDPEKIPSGTEKISGGAHDKQLAKLRAKASETGDMSPVLAYKRKHNLK